MAAELLKAAGYSLDDPHRADAGEGGQARRGPEEVIRERMGRHGVSTWNPDRRELE